MKKVILVMMSSLLLTVPNVMAEEKMSNIVFNPFEEIQKMQQEMEKIFERFHKKMIKEDTFSKFRSTFPTTPVMDLVDEGDIYVVKADIPGVEKSKIDINVEDGVIKIEAEISKDKKEESKGYLKQERFVSSYMRMITLPEDANSKEWTSEYKDGVLKITIPKQKK
ncbi:MAG: hypothetical protein DRQ78_12540 [Epsilonproteobacteria bacterium]|nr:MAG: hypothetical protein DRQ78_12540 [Campylobacterota bacterium]